MGKRKREQQEDEIINTRVAALVTELRAKGFKAEGFVGFVAYEGHDFHIVTVMNGAAALVDPDKFRLALLNYAHDQICDLISSLEGDTDPPERGSTH